MRRRPTRLAVATGLALAAMLGCAHRAPGKDAVSGDDRARAVVEDPASDPAALLEAAANVPAGAPATLWSGVANDARFAPFHRSLAAWQLLRRHVPSGTSIDDAAARLAGATWLADAELEKITELGGELPVAIPEGGAAFVLRLPRGAAAGVPDLGAYLAVDRDTDAATLRAALMGLPDGGDGGALRAAHLSGVAVFPDTLGPG